MPGRLYLVPNLLGMVAPDAVLPARSLDVARRLRHYVVENAKPARQFLNSIEALTPLQQIAIFELDAAPSPQRCRELLAPARVGDDLGLLSDAGCPAVADPGALLVAAAHREGIQVVPLVGPSAILLALMASGFNGQGFCFHGYLPIKPAARTAAIRRLEAAAQQSGATQLCIETPYRNVALIEAFLATCSASTLLCVAADLSLPTETIVTRPILEWRKRDLNSWSKRPAMFLLHTSR